MGKKKIQGPRGNDLYGQRANNGILDNNLFTAQERLYAADTAKRTFNRVYRGSNEYFDDYLNPATEMDMYAPKSEVANMYGQSSYDRVFQDFDKTDIQNNRAEQQPWLLQIGNGILKGGILIGTTFAQSIGTLFGAVGALATLDASMVIDNPINNLLQDLNEKSEEWLPNYRTTAEEEEPWYHHINANWVGDVLIKNAGFTIGALISGGLAAKGLSAVGNFITRSMASKRGLDLTKGLLSGLRNAKNASEATAFLRNAANVQSVTSAIGGSFIGAINEGAIEGMNIMREYKKQGIQELEGAHAQRLNEIYEEYGDTPESRKLADEENERYYNSLQRLDHDGNMLANETLMLNIPILTASNMLMFGKLFGGGFKNATKENLVDGLFGAYKKKYDSGWAKAGAIIKNPLSEGSEEYLQRAASESGKDYYTTDLNRYYKTGIKHDGNTILDDNGRNLFTMISDFGKGIAKEFVNPQAWEEFTVGAIMGAIGVPVVRSNTNEKGEKQSGIVMSGGIWDSLKELDRKAELSAETADILNKASDSKLFKDAKLLANTLYSSMNSRDRMQEDAENGDKKDYLDEEHTELIKMISAFDRAGRLGDIMDVIKSSFNDMSDEDLNELINSTTKLVTADSQMQSLEDSIDFLRSKKDSLLYSDSFGEYGVIHDDKVRIDELEAKEKGGHTLTKEEKAEKSMLERRIKYNEKQLKEIQDDIDKLENERRSASFYDKYVGPYTDSNGRMLDLYDTKDKIDASIKAVEETIQRFIDTKDMMLNNIREHVSDDDLGELVWLRMMAENNAKRADEIAEKHFPELSRISKNIRRVADSISLQMEYETNEDKKKDLKIQHDYIKNLADNFEKYIAERGIEGANLIGELTEDELKEFVRDYKAAKIISDYHNFGNEFRSQSDAIDYVTSADASMGEDEAIEDIHNRIDSLVDDDDVTKDINDIYRLGVDFNAYERKLAEYINNPLQQFVDHLKAQMEMDQQEMEKQFTNIKDALKDYVNDRPAMITKLLSEYYDKIPLIKQWLDSVENKDFEDGSTDDKLRSILQKFLDFATEKETLKTSVDTYKDNDGNELSDDDKNIIKDFIEHLFSKAHEIQMGNGSTGVNALLSGGLAAFVKKCAANSGLSDDIKGKIADILNKHRRHNRQNAGTAGGGNNGNGGNNGGNNGENNNRGSQKRKDDEDDSSYKDKFDEKSRQNFSSPVNTAYSKTLEFDLAASKNGKAKPNNANGANKKAIEALRNLGVYEFVSNGGLAKIFDSYTNGKIPVTYIRVTDNNSYENWKDLTGLNLVAIPAPRSFVGNNIVEANGASYVVIGVAGMNQNSDTFNGLDSEWELKGKNSNDLVYAYEYGKSKSHYITYDGIHNGRIVFNDDYDNSYFLDSNGNIRGDVKIAVQTDSGLININGVDGINDNEVEEVIPRTSGRVYILRRSPNGMYNAFPIKQKWTDNITSDQQEFLISLLSKKVKDMSLLTSNQERARAIAALKDILYPDDNGNFHLSIDGNSIVYYKEGATSPIVIDKNISDDDIEGIASDIINREDELYRIQYPIGNTDDIREMRDEMIRHGFFTTNLNKDVDRNINASINIYGDGITVNANVVTGGNYRNRIPAQRKFNGYSIDSSNPSSVVVTNKNGGIVNGIEKEVILHLDGIEKFGRDKIIGVNIINPATNKKETIFRIMINGNPVFVQTNTRGKVGEASYLGNKHVKSIIGNGHPRYQEVLLEFADFERVLAEQQGGGTSIVSKDEYDKAAEYINKATGEGYVTINVKNMSFSIFGQDPDAAKKMDEIISKLVKSDIVKVLDDETLQVIANTKRTTGDVIAYLDTHIGPNGATINGIKTELMNNWHITEEDIDELLNYVLGDDGNDYVELNGRIVVRQKQGGNQGSGPSFNVSEVVSDVLANPNRTISNKRHALMKAIARDSDSIDKIVSRIKQCSLMTEDGFKAQVANFFNNTTIKRNNYQEAVEGFLNSLQCH